MIKNIVQDELRYFRHYDGIVVDTDDPTTQGRVRVRINALGQFNASQGFWAKPRQLHALDVPIVGEVVEVYFIEGDRTKGVYLANSAESKGNIPVIYSDPAKHVLYQDPTTGDSMVYDHNAKTFTMLMNQITLAKGDEAFVKGTTFYSFMTSLMIWLGTHIHTSGGSGSPTTPPTVAAPSMTDFRSTVIKGT